jgi:hypothetical protein
MGAEAKKKKKKNDFIQLLKKIPMFLVARSLAKKSTSLSIYISPLLVKSGNFLGLSATPSHTHSLSLSLSLWRSHNNKPLYHIAGLFFRLPLLLFEKIT